MVTSWRKLWAHDFPFGFVQLAGYAGSKQQTVAQLRRQQLAASGQEGVFFAVAMDLADPAVEADLNVTQPASSAHILAYDLCRSSHHLWTTSQLFSVLCLRGIPSPAALT